MNLDINNTIVVSGELEKCYLCFTDEGIEVNGGEAEWKTALTCELWHPAVFVGSAGMRAVSPGMPASGQTVSTGMVPAAMLAWGQENKGGSVPQKGTVGWKDPFGVKENTRLRNKGVGDVVAPSQVFLSQVFQVGCPLAVLGMAYEEQGYR